MQIDNDQNQVSRDAILNSITQEASGFYNSILTIVTAFLAGSLLFLKELIHDFPPKVPGYLYTGWFFLLICLILSLWFVI